MATAAHSGTSPDAEITTAADFLTDLRRKGYNDVDLRKYLIQTRGLSFQQVNEAFAISQQRMSDKDNKRSKHNLTNCGRPPNIAQKNRKGPGIPERDRSTNVQSQSPSNAERPEKSIAPQTKKSNVLGFLLPHKQEGGRKLIKEFLTNEWNYCIVLECLKNEYHAQLVKMAGERKLRMAKKDIDKIFRHIPKLLKFHRTFYRDLSQGSNIGRMFVRLFDFFKGYGEYMKDCAATIKKMREYTRDMRLHDILKEIKSRSRRTKDDMTDLLLVPLDRIIDYHDFLTTLYLWADSNQRDDYIFLGKAKRRIGRVAKYIETYKHGILNRNEMNKIQTFLGKQCEILSVRRRIVRRGMMIRRTTGWPPRNKHYIFLLFNDVLVWTTRKGDLQNVVLLSNCVIGPSDSKNNTERKFKIMVSLKDRRDKILLLECSSKRQRDEWYNAVEMTISSGGKSNRNCEISSIVNPSIDLKSESSSDEEEEEQTDTLAKGTPPSMENTVNLCAPGKESTIGEMKQNADNDQPSNFDISDDTYDENYERSHNYIYQELKEFGEMDDTESQVSEFDREFCEKYLHYDGKQESTSLSAFTSMVPSKYDSSGHVAILRENVSSGGEQKKFERRSLGKLSLGENHQRGPKKSTTPRTQFFNRGSIIRRLSEKSSVEAAHKLERSSSLRIRLDDGILSIVPNTLDLERSSTFAIRLNDFDDYL